jgi:uncharacterized membrane protein
MAQKKKKQKHRKKIQQRERKKTREKMSTNQIIFLGFSIIIIITMVIGSLASSF